MDIYDVVTMFQVARHTAFRNDLQMLLGVSGTYLDVKKQYDAETTAAAKLILSLASPLDQRDTSERIP